MAWTNEMVEGLKKMWKQGLTTNEIAKNLGVSKNSIVGKVHRLNLTARPSPIKKKEEESEEQIAVVKETPQSQVETKTVKKISPAPAEAKPAAEKTAGSSACLRLTELDNHSCRWPIGDPRDDNFCFCGKKVRGGQTYCEEHSAMAFVKPGKKG